LLLVCDERKQQSPARMPENEIGQPLARGVVGLCNLGNTCFMNSTLQCLSAVSPLLSLLALESEFAPHLNTTGNPNSSKGELARSLSRLFGEMWGGQCKGSIVFCLVLFAENLEKWSLPTISKKSCLRGLLNFADISSTTRRKCFSCS